MKRHVIFMLLILAVSMAIYVNTLQNGFVYDDEDTVVNNSLIRNFENLPKLFKDEYVSLSGETSYRPIVTLSYFIDYAVFEVNPRGYHLTNVLLHTVNGVLLYVFLTMLCKTEANSRMQDATVRITKPFLISVMFVSHPALTETVNAISFREDLLVFFFYMITLVLYLILRADKGTMRQSSHSILYALSCIAYMLALLSKEMAATLPLAICCLEWGYLNKRPFWMHLTNRYNIGYITATFIYGYLWFFYSTKMEISYPPIFERLLTIPSFQTAYLKLLLFPISLSADYRPTLVKSLFSPLFIAPFLVITLLSSTFFFIKKRLQSPAFGFLFYIIALLPVYPIVSIINPFAERYLYLPSVGIIIVIGSFVHLLYDNLIKTGRYIVGVVMFFMLAVSSANIIHRNTVWKDNYSLWSDVIRKMPNSFRAHNELGIYYLDSGRLDDAIKHFQTALRLSPTFSCAHNNLGLVYYKQGRLDEAIEEYLITIKLKPDYFDARMNLRNAYRKLNKN